MEKTIVVFRKFNEGGDLIALFPAETFSAQGGCNSYQRIGQHGAADYNHCMKISKAATPQEYQALRQELENIGYKLDVKLRYRRG